MHHAALDRLPRFDPPPFRLLGRGVFWPSRGVTVNRWAACWSPRQSVVPARIPPLSVCGRHARICA